MQKRDSLYHVLGWTIFILYEMALLLIFQPFETTLPNLAYYPFFILQFYVCTRLIKIGFKLAKPMFILTLVGQWVVFAAVVWIVGVGINDVSVTKAFNKMDVSKVLWRSGYFSILATTYWFIRQHIRNVKQEAQLQLELLQSQNAYLRAQVNPHLLFNTLNVIHSNVLDNEEASTSIQLLSEVMQYASVQDSEDGKAPLYLEIEQLEKQVQLYGLTNVNSNSVKLDTDTSGTKSSYRIPPLLLLTFIENMFKHGDDTEQYHIRLYCENDLLHFTTKNGIRLEGNTSGQQTGLRNAEKRLSNLYDKVHYDLRFEENENTFIVNLIIKL
jgi:two-component system, LytTR family, sensor kinase